jgi:molybdopterin-binding protein
VKLSARNLIPGTSHGCLGVGGTIVASSITNEAVDDLNLKAGRKANAVIKASDVMIGVD